MHIMSIQTLKIGWRLSVLRCSKMDVFCNRNFRPFYYLKCHNRTMAKRITVMIDDDILVKVRKLQSEMIKKSEKSVSFSKTINEVLRLSMKK